MSWPSVKIKADPSVKVGSVQFKFERELSREEVIQWLRGLELRNQRRPLARGYTEFGIMAGTAADMLEEKQ